jgi:hypothetical protein
MALTLAPQPPWSTPLRDDSLLRAISILCSPVFGALSMAHSLGSVGQMSDEWRALYEHTPRALVEEAIERNLDFTSLKAVCCDVLVIDTPVFHNILMYDPRPKCSLCNRPHWVPSDGTRLSCGDAARFRRPPEWKWTRQTIEQAVEGKYKSQRGESDV